ncbi:MAG: hypothetical protein NTW21_16330 [Verrucomicrobia bacterium]|nr:hypothetical protein [Verrucomicrobiota bacterium]
MSTNYKKATIRGKRYTDAEKQEVIAFAHKVNAENGRGGQSAAAKKYGISVLTVSTWLKAPAKAAKGAKPAAAAKPVVAAKPEAKPAKKQAKKQAKKNSAQGKRYSDEQKQAVLDYVVAVNTSKGRGGLSAATKKFRVSPLTISAWIKKAGLKMPKAAAAVKAAKPSKAVTAAPATSGLSPKVMMALGNQIDKAELELSKLKVMIAAIR